MFILFMIQTQNFLQNLYRRAFKGKIEKFLTKYLKFIFLKKLRFCVCINV